MKLLEYRFRPKGDYVSEASWQELYLLTEHYKKELSFFAFELQFFEKLLATYNHIQNDNLAKMDQLVKNAGMLLKTIITQMEEHLKQIAQIIKKEKDLDETAVREEQYVMEDTLTTFAESFRTLKAMLFQEIERHIRLF